MSDVIGLKTKAVSAIARGKAFQSKQIRSGGMLLACVLVLAGCVVDPIVPTDLNPPPIETASDEVPDYGELVRRYNQNAAALDRVWARTKVELRWRDDKNRRRRESGDGRLIFERPLNTAWTVEVLGDIKLWAGSNVSGFWVFDRLGGGKAYYGAYGKPLARPLPLPLQPEAMPYLIGLMPLDPDHRPTAPEVVLLNGYFVIEPPGLNLRMMLDPQTARPARIDLLDPDGASALTCILTGEIAVKQDSEVEIFLPQTAEIYPQGQESRMTVTFKKATSDAKKIKRKWFDFEGLVKALKPDEVVDLNRLP